MNVLLCLSYNGANYGGWQRQENAIAVQNVVEDALSSLLGKRIVLTGSGRTDAGVHAFRQYANFHIDEMRIPVEKLPYALKGKLPNDIICREAKIVNDEFNARFSAKEKEYRYFFYTDISMKPFLQDRAVFFDADAEQLQEALEIFKGKHDFAGFSCVNNPKKDSQANTTRTITDIGASVLEGKALGYIYIRSSGFLYKMVRRIVGCVFDFSKGKIKKDNIISALQNGYTLDEWNTAAPYALYLWQVWY